MIKCTKDVTSEDGHRCDLKPQFKNKSNYESSFCKIGCAHPWEYSRPIVKPNRQF
jgi:hypothetical protein